MKAAAAGKLLGLTPEQIVWACGIVIHPIIDACLELRGQHGFDHGDVAGVAVKAHHVAITLAGRRHPADRMQAKVSIAHWVAVALVDGEAGIAQLDRVDVPEVVALRERVESVADPAIAPDAADVVIELRDGRRLHRHIEHGIGSADNPMSDRDLDRKFTNLAHGVLDAGAIAALLGQCWKIWELPDAGTVGRAAA